MSNFPECILEKISELHTILERYPHKMPLTVAADFLEMNTEGLMAALMRGNTPFGFAYQKQNGGNRVAVIPSATFYLWYTNVHGVNVRTCDMR